MWMISRWLLVLVLMAPVPVMADDGAPLSFGTHSGMSKAEISESVKLEKLAEADGKIQYRSMQAPDNRYAADEYFYVVGDAGLCRNDDDDHCFFRSACRRRALW